MTNDERKEKLKIMLDELLKLDEKERLTEFASLVYAKCAVRQITDDLKTICKSPDELAQEATKSPVVGAVVSAIATYGAMGFEMGYATMKGVDNVSE